MKKLINIVESLVLLIISIIVIFQSVLAFYPSYFENVLDKTQIEEFGQESLVGLSLDRNNFTIIDSDPQMYLTEILTGYNEVIIKFTNDCVDELNGVNCQIYFGNDYCFSEENSLVERIDGDRVVFKIDEYKFNTYRIDIGSEERITYGINKIIFRKVENKKSLAKCIKLVFPAIALWAICLFLLKRLKKKGERKTARESNIELCRVVCMLLIIAHHCSVHGGAFDMPEMCNNKLFALLLIPGGKICFDCFIAISCWFLVDQKYKAERFLKIWGQVFFYSVTFYFVSAMINSDFSVKDFLSTLLPISGNSHGFAASYIAFYLCTPFLKLVSDKLTKRASTYLIICLVYFEVASKIIGYINNYTQSISSELLLFVLMYFVVHRIKKWPIDLYKNKGLLISVFSTIWILLWSAQYLYSIYPMDPVVSFIINTMCDESSITNIVAGISLFLFFNNVKIKPNIVINYLATATFGILLMHDHNYFRYPLWKKLFATETWFGSSHFVERVIMCVIAVYFYGLIVELLRKKLVEKLVFSSKTVRIVSDKLNSINK